MAWIEVKPALVTWLTNCQEIPSQLLDSASLIADNLTNATMQYEGVRVTGPETWAGDTYAKTAMTLTNFEEAGSQLATEATGGYMQATASEMTNTLSIIKDAIKFASEASEYYVAAELADPDGSVTGWGYYTKITEHKKYLGLDDETREPLFKTVKQTYAVRADGYFSNMEKALDFKCKKESYEIAAETAIKALQGGGVAVTFNVNATSLTSPGTLNFVTGEVLYPEIDPMDNYNDLYRALRSNPEYADFFDGKIGEKERLISSTDEEDLKATVLISDGLGVEHNPLTQATGLGLKGQLPTLEELEKYRNPDEYPLSGRREYVEVPVGDSTFAITTFVTHSVEPLVEEYIFYVRNEFSKYAVEGSCIRISADLNRDSSVKVFIDTTYAKDSDSDILVFVGEEKLRSDLQKIFNVAQTYAITPPKINLGSAYTHYYRSRSECDDMYIFEYRGMTTSGDNDAVVTYENHYGDKIEYVRAEGQGSWEATTVPNLHYDLE